MGSPQKSGTTVASTESLTFDDISKFFSMPIADAANILGVCSSVLKKICRDNGVVRWPYRKFLAGKSVEEIQKDAARERKRELIELSKAARQKDVATTSSFTASNILQQQENKSSQDKWLNHMLHCSPTDLDEFKQGFPSNGLSTITIKWWGGSSFDGIEDEILGEELAIDQVEKQESHDLADNEDEFIEQEADTRTDQSNIGPQGTALLSSVRERAAVEGRETLNIGVCKGNGGFKLRRREKLLLRKVFESYLPSQWQMDPS